jgi:hypothetical protein
MMRTGLQVMAAIAVIMAVVSGCTTVKSQVPEEEFLALVSGTWVNDEGGERFPPGMAELDFRKVVVQTDGTLQNFKNVEDALATFTTKPEYADIWRDGQGNLWYMCGHNFMGTWPCYELAKISDSGRVFERLIRTEPYGEWRGNRPLKNWAPEDEGQYLYYIFYRR